MLHEQHGHIKEFYNGDPYENRTRVTAVKGPCLNRLTNGPWSTQSGYLLCGPHRQPLYEIHCVVGSGNWIRTGDTSGMNRML